jgi:hypothetical protein
MVHIGFLSLGALNVLEVHPIKAKLAELGAATVRGSAAEYAKLIVEETEKWAKVVKFAGIKAE